MGHLKQSMVTLIGRAIPAAVGLGSIAIYTRLLDPASVGAYVLLLAASLLATSIGFAWLRNAVLRIVAGEPDCKISPNVAATIVLAFLGTALAIGALEAIALVILRPGLTPLSLWLGVAAAVAIGWYDLNATLMQAQLRLVFWGVLNLSRAVAALVGSVVCIRFGLKSDALMIGFIVGNLAALAFVSTWSPALRGRFDRELFLRLVSFGWPLSVKAGLEQVAPTAQRFIVNFWIGTTAVGLYSIANDFTAQTLGSIMGSISLAGIPLAFQARDRGGVAALNEQLLRNARLIGVIGAPLTCGVAVLATTIASVFFGPSFRTGAEPVIVLISVAALLGNLRVYYFDQAFELALDTRPQPIIQAIGTVVMIALSLALIPHLAAFGAAVAFFVSTIVTFGVSVWWGAKHLRVPIPTGSWLKTGLATLGMVVVLALIPKHGGIVELLTLGSLGALTYIALSLLLRMGLVRAQFGQRFASSTR